MVLHSLLTPVILTLLSIAPASPVSLELQRPQETEESNVDSAKATEAAVLRALETADGLALNQAGWLLGSRGSAEAAAALVKLAGTASVDRFGSVITGLNVMVSRGMVKATTLEDVLAAAAQQEGDLARSRLAVTGLRSLREWSATTDSLMRALRSSEDLEIRVAATCGVARRFPKERAMVRELIREMVPCRFDFQFASCLKATGDESDLGALRVLMGSRRRLARDTAEVAFDVIQSARRDPNEDWRAFEALWIPEARAGKGAMMRTEWVPATREELAMKLGAARCVLFGELHDEGGTLRAGQIEALNDFSRSPEHEALGYEPSVLGVQQPVVDAARQIGIETLSTEPGWQDLRRAARYRERDRRTASCINGYLAKDPSNRIFVIRGEDHLKSTGLLRRSLAARPLVILSDSHALPSFSDTEGKLDLSNLVFRSSADPNVYRYCLPYSTFACPSALIEWIDAHPHGD